MKQVFRIDDRGFFVEPVMIAEDEELPGDCVDEMPPYGLYKPRFNGGQILENAFDAGVERRANELWTASFSMPTVHPLDDGK